MRIDFPDQSFIEININPSNKVVILIQAKDHENPLKRISNSCEITIEEFKKLCSEIIK